MFSTFTLFRRRRTYLSDLLEHDVPVRLAGADDRAIANPFVATRDLVDTLRTFAAMA